MNLQETSILAIETSCSNCSIAVSSQGEVFQLEESGAKIHSRRILSMVDEVLDRVALKTNQLGCLVVDTGPGSFTGLRTGIGVAQGLAYSAGIGVLPVSSLEMLALSAGPGLVLSAIDARMGQVYCCLYRVEPGERPQPVTKTMVVNPDQIPVPVDQPFIAAGSGWLEYADQIQPVLSDRNLPQCDSDFTLAVPQAKHAISAVAGVDKCEMINAVNLSAIYVRNQVASKKENRISTLP